MSIQIEKAKEQYSKADDSGKKLLEEIFGRDCFVSSDDWMKLWDKFCQDNKLQLELPYPSYKNSDEEYLNAHFMMMYIFRIKRPKKPDYTNIDEYKYNGVFDLSKGPGFGLSYCGFDSWDSYSSCGSRLSMPNDKNLLISICKEYLPIWKKIMIEP